MGNLDGVFRRKSNRHTDDYLASITSERWKKLKLIIFNEIKQDETGCEECGVILESVNDYDLHHIHYDTIGEESRDDVMLVCRDCHYYLDREREESQAIKTFAIKKYGSWHEHEWSFLRNEFEKWKEWKFNNG